MNLRFKVNLRASFARGIDAEPIQTIDVDPSSLPEDNRELIVRHLLPSDSGLDVVYDPEHALDESWVVPVGDHPPDELVETKGPSLDDLVEALQQLESPINKNLHVVHFSAHPIDAKRLRPGTHL